MESLFTVINQRSSIRAYLPKPLTPEQIELVVEAGLRAPTARNEQELHFSVVDTGHPLMREIQSALNPAAQTPFYYNAPTVILISGADDFKWSRLDAGIAVENMHLAARGLGLGSVILGCIADIMTGEKKDDFNRALGIPSGYSFEIALALGYPDTDKTQHTFDREKNVTYIG